MSRAASHPLKRAFSRCIYAVDGRGEKPINLASELANAGEMARTLVDRGGLKMVGVSNEELWCSVDLHREEIFDLLVDDFSTSASIFGRQR